jgi:preprotein translocase subunit SecG
MTTLLHKITIWCGIGFMVTSLVLFMMSGSRPASSGSLLEDAQQRGEFGDSVPAVPLEVPQQDQMETPPPVSGDDGADDQGEGGGQ